MRRPATAQARPGARDRARRLAGRALAALLAVVATASLAGCGDADGANGMRYQIAGGGTAGVYYGYGDRLAQALQRHAGLDIAVAETNGSVDNLLRVASGEAIAGFAQGDTAADAIAGAAGFDAPLEVAAVARVYDEYVHVVVPEDSEVREVADLAGRRVSLGAENSGVTVIAERVLAASDVGVDDVDDAQLSLNSSIEALQNGEIDGFFWVGGLPTPGIRELADAMPVRLLPIGAESVDRVNSGHAGVYGIAEFPVGTYGSGEATATMTVPNYLITAESAPDDLIYDVTRVLFEARAEIARDVPAAEFLDRQQAIFTAPMELHPGAAEYYVDTRR